MAEARMYKKEHPRLKRPDQTTSVTESGGLFTVRFPYDPAKVAYIKTVPGRRWDPNNKCWTVPANAISAKMLREVGFTVPQADAQSVEAGKGVGSLEGFGKTLMPFQMEGFKAIHKFGGRILIGDDMGLGKTIQALAYIYAQKKERPVLVICPTTMKPVWAAEVRSTCPGVSYNLVSGRKREALPKADIHIIGYDVVAARLGDLLGAKFQVLVLDECHYLKNRSAQRTKAVLGVGKKATGLSSIPTIIALSGTPFLSRPVEIYPVIKALAPNKIPPFMTFAHQYCGATHNGFGWDFNGCSNAEELFQLLISAVMIRRTKTEVLKDLPDKTRTVIPLEMEKKARQEYKKANQHFLGWLKSVNPDKLSAAMRAEALVQFQELKKLARKGKWAAAMEWLQDTLESCDKVIIFGTHHETVDLLMDGLQKHNPVKLDGRSSPKAKEEAVKRFQEDPTCKVFIGNVKAAGVGLTLTAANVVVFMELGWTPGEHNQAEDRAHRIGQKKAVNIYYLLAEDTIEMQIAALLDRKRRVLDAVLDGKETESTALLVELLHKYMQEQR